jgi:hypothetical protein
VLLLSGVLAWLTTKYVENPLRYRGTAKRQESPRPIPLRARLRRPTIALGSIVGLLGVALTATSFTWREHVTVQRANGKSWQPFDVDYPGAHALLDNAPRCRKLPMRPTVLEAKDDLPETTMDGCISDFDSVDVISCATATSRRRGSSRSRVVHTPKHWITALDLLGKLHHFKVTTYLKMGCPLTTEQVPLVMGDNRPYPKCHTWNDAVMKRIIADRPNFVFTTATRPWNIKAGDVMPGTYVGIWQTLSDNNIPFWRCGTRSWLVRKGPAILPRRLPRPRRQRHFLRDQAIGRALQAEPGAGLGGTVPAAETPRHERRGVPKRRLPRRRGKRPAVPRLSPHLEVVHAHDGR